MTSSWTPVSEKQDEGRTLGDCTWFRKHEADSSTLSFSIPKLNKIFNKA